MSSSSQHRKYYRLKNNIPEDAPKYGYRKGKPVIPKEERDEIHRQKSRLKYWVKKGMPMPSNKEFRDGRWRLPKEDVEARIAEYRKWYEKNVKFGLLSTKFRNLRSLSKKRNIEVTITFEEFKTLQSKPCHYCEKPLPKYGYGLDRLDNSKGYVTDNVVPSCASCNKTKSNNLSPDEMKMLIEFRRSK